MISTKKQIAIALFALVLSFLAIALAQNAIDTAMTNASININESQVTNLSVDLNKKVNKSGDTMTNDLIVNTIIYSGNGSTSNVGFITNSSSDSWNYFQNKGTNKAAIGYRNSTNTLEMWSPILGTVLKVNLTSNYLTNNKIIYSGDGTTSDIGFITNSSSDSWNYFQNKGVNKAAIGYRNSTNTLEMWSPTLGTVLKLDQGTGNITINKLSGSGNAYVCVDSTGTLYRSSLACV